MEFTYLKHWAIVLIEHASPDRPNRGNPSALASTLTKTQCTVFLRGRREKTSLNEPQLSKKQAQLSVTGIALAERTWECNSLFFMCALCLAHTCGPKNFIAIDAFDGTVTDCRCKSPFLMTKLMLTCAKVPVKNGLPTDKMNGHQGKCPERASKRDQAQVRSLSLAASVAVLSIDR